MKITGLIGILFTLTAFIRRISVHAVLVCTNRIVVVLSKIPIQIEWPLTSRTEVESMGNKIIFLITRPEFTVNVVIEAPDLEIAKRYAQHILGGDPDYYVVTPITERGSSTVFILGGTR